MTASSRLLLFILKYSSLTFTISISTRLTIALFRESSSVPSPTMASRMTFTKLRFSVKTYDTTKTEIYLNSLHQDDNRRSNIMSLDTLFIDYASIIHVDNMILFPCTTYVLVSHSSTKSCT